MRGFETYLTVAIVGLTAGACASSTEPDVVNYCARVDSIRAAFSPVPPVWSDRHEAIIAARAVPGGYGGHFPAQGAQFVVILRDTTQGSAAKAALAEAVACGALQFGEQPALFLGAQLQLGRYDAEQLFAFTDLASSAGTSLGGCAVLTSWPDNAVVVWVEDAADVPQVEAAVVAAGVPSNALIVQAVGCPQQ